MGMYDNIKINKSMLPISEAEKETMEEFEDFQSRDFRCLLDEYEIRDDGTLWWNKEGWGEKLVPREEPLHWYYNGTLNFYTDINNEWIEFNATFKDGIMVGIERINSR